MRTQRTMALAATLSIAAAAVITDLPSGAVAAHAEVTSSRPSDQALAALRACESGGDYTADSGDGYYGAYQFAAGTWQSLGYGGYASEAPAAVQDEAVVRLWAASGWSSWPGCSLALNLPSMGTVDASSHAVVAAAWEATMAVDEPPPPPPAVENGPVHSRFSNLVAEFG